MGLRKQLQEALEKINELKHENQELRKLCEELERKLKLYESPHISSSKRIVKVKVIEKPRRPKKRGAPKGHKGATRKRPAPDKIVELEPVCCPKCDIKDIKKLKKHKKIVEDIKIIKTTTEFHWYEVVCKNGHKFAISSEDLPKHGNFGPNITSLWTILHYVGIIPFDRLAQISGSCFDMSITQGGIHNAIYRTAGIFEPHFNRIKNRLIKSNYLRSDETKYPFNGDTKWLWNLSNGKDTLVLIRDSRSSKVLKEVFGKFLDAVLNSDCFSCYGKFKAREYQKCWAHVLRDAEHLAKHNEEGKQLHRMLLRMYRYIKNAKENCQENTPQVKQWVQRQKRKILQWVEKNYKSKAVLNLALRMAKYKEDWFTCLKYDFVEPTNNGSEREIRKNVLARKISGQHRSEMGKHSREVMMSVIITMQKRGKNVFEFIQDEIKKHNLKQNLKPS